MHRLYISSDGLSLLQSSGLKSRYFDSTSKRKRDLTLWFIQF